MGRHHEALRRAETCLRLLKQISKSGDTKPNLHIRCIHFALTMDMTPEDNMDGPNVYAIVHYNIAVELEHLKRRQEALESYQKALKYVDPSSMLAPAIQE